VETLSRNDIENIKKNVVLMKVSSDESNTKLSYDGTAISYNRLNPRTPDQIVIYMDPLSDLPTKILDIKRDITEPWVSFVGKNIRALNHFNLNSIEPNEWLSYLKENLINKLILVRPFIKEDVNAKEFEEKYFWNYEIVYISNEEPDSERYYTVPTVVSNINRRRFETLLDNRSFFQLSNYNGMMTAPEFIICEDALYHLQPNALESNQRNLLSFSCINPKGIMRIKLPQLELKENSRCTYQGHHFVRQEYAMQLREIFKNEGKPLGQELEDTISVLADKKDEQKPVDKGDVKEPKQEKGQLKEYEFLSAFKNRVINSNLYYIDVDLHNFHTAVKTNNLTIVAGMSGTGKSRLVMEYAKTMGLKNGDQDHLLIIPINPAYTEPNDLLGYLNIQTGAYVESETGLTRFLYKASQNPDRLFMVVFEELNLAQVEHWFSPFIPLLEQEPEERYLTLVGDRQFCIQEEYRKPIHIGDNVIWIGTANLDETTKEFSNRLLDRANLISLNKQPFLDAKNTEEALVAIPEYKFVSARNFRSWIKISKNPLKDTMYDNELALLEAFHRAINEADPKNGVSFRVVSAIGNYIKNIPTDEKGEPYIARQNAFDIQLCQRVLTKIKGHREMLKDLLGNYNNDTGRVDGGKLIQALNEYDEDNVDKNFSLSLEVIKQKAKELVVHGYTM